MWGPIFNLMLRARNLPEDKMISAQCRKLGSQYKFLKSLLGYF
jgi:hypothetical protein